MANIRSSNGRKLKKTLFLLFGILLAFLCITIPIVVYNFNKPYPVDVVTNIDSNQKYEIKIEKGSRLKSLKPVEIEGYNFVGWFKDEEYSIQFKNDEKIEKGTKLYALYQIKKFQVYIPINESYEIFIPNGESTVCWGEDFTFVLNINPGYVSEEIQLLCNDKPLEPVSKTRDSLTYKVEAVETGLDFELLGSVSKLVKLSVYVDGNLTEYDVKDTNDLRRYFTTINQDGHTEYNTIGLFYDADFTKPADLNMRIKNDTIVHTKTANISGNFEWSWNDQTKSWSVNITSLTAGMTAIPCKYAKSSFDGYVTQIVGNLYNENLVAKEIYLPATIQSLGEYSFYRFNSLEKINLPETISNIGSGVFQECSKLNNISIPNGVTNIGNFTFDSCSSLNEIDISASIIGIGYYAFNNCSNLQTVNFASDSSLTNIGGMAFANCTSLTEISIPNSVTIVGYANFYGCTSLEKVNLPAKLEIIGDYAFYNCEKLNFDMLPNNIRDIGAQAFYNCKALTLEQLPENITEIKTYTFGNTGLKKIKIPDNVRTIGDKAFMGASYLERVEFPSNLKTISTEAFRACVVLKYSSFSASATNNFVIPEGVSSIKGSAFFACFALEKVTIPSTVTGTNFANYAFASCYNLEEVEFFEGANITNIYQNTFQSCRKLKSINIPNSVTQIGAAAFNDCLSLEEIRLPDNLIRIEIRAFEKCSALETITNVHTKLKIISDYAFSDCVKLNNVLIPSSITTFGAYVFNGCTGLKNVVIESDMVCSKITDVNTPGYLIAKAEEIKVLSSIEVGVDHYLTMNYSKSTEGNYNVFRKL